MVSQLKCVYFITLYESNHIKKEFECLIQFLQSGKLTSNPGVSIHSVRVLIALSEYILIHTLREEIFAGRKFRGFHSFWQNPQN